MYEGIADYLDIMRLAGVSELRRACVKPGNENFPIRSVAPSAALPSVALPPGNDVETGRQTPQTVASKPSATATPTSISRAVAPPPTANVPLPPPGKHRDLYHIAEEVAMCTLCKDIAASRTQTVFGSGNPDSSLVFIGEAPGMEEDKQGQPFVGRAGQLLTDIIEKGMLMRREDVYICNILRCRPPGNRNPMPDESAHCRPFLDRTLAIIRPKFICCLGAIAAKSLLSSDKPIGALRGQVWNYPAEWDSDGIKVVCTYHPAYLLRNPAAKKDTWIDIQMLLREME